MYTGRDGENYESFELDYDTLEIPEMEDRVNPEDAYSWEEYEAWLDSVEPKYIDSQTP